jgi:penicillin amidase
VAAASLGLALPLALPHGSLDAAELTIKRDRFGTPHIYADDTYGLFYGYGYAIAQDRLYQLEIAKRSTQGRVAEVLGKDYAEFDSGIRRNYSPAAIRQQLAALPKADMDILDGYAAGINQWLKEIERQPGKLMPKQFLDNGFQPEPWTGYDVAMVFIGSMLNRFGDYNTELQNQQLLDGLISKHGADKGRRLFDLLVSVDNPDSPTTVPKGEWDPAKRAAAWAPPKKGAKVAASDQTAPLLASLAPRLPPAGLEDKAFSNILVLGAKKSREARAILINGPQFGFFQPAYTYSIGLHGAGYDAVGNSPFGYPLVQFGYNRDISWGSTWGAGDNVDIFRLELNPANPEQYRYRGTWRSLEKRSETIRVKGEADRNITVYRSVHGPVVDYQPDKGIAFTKRRGWEGQEVATLISWNKVGKARDHQAWLDQVQHSALNVNWYYADRQGNIGYALGGRYPIRTQGQDNRLPTAGGGELDWQGFMPFASNPQVYNPSTGYIANWNNRPAEGFPNPDQFWYSWNAADRVETLLSRVEAQQTFTPEEAWALMMDASFEDPNARFLVPRLLKAVQGSGDTRLTEAARQLAIWDYQEHDKDRDGKYDLPATPIFRSWLGHLQKLLLADLLPEQQAAWFLRTGHYEPGKGSPGSQNIEIATKVIHQAIVDAEAGRQGAFPLLAGKDIDALMRQALSQAVDELGQAQGSDVSRWRTPVSHTLYGQQNFLKIPQAGQDEALQNHLAMNRGTENNMTVFAAEGVRGYEVAAPGQSGFIAPDGSRSPHYSDQLELFGDLGHKPTWLSDRDVAANSLSETRLSY